MSIAISQRRRRVQQISPPWERWLAYRLSDHEQRERNNKQSGEANDQDKSRMRPNREAGFGPLPVTLIVMPSAAERLVQKRPVEVDNDPLDHPV